MEAVIVLGDADIKEFDFNEKYIIGVEKGCILLLENKIPIHLSIGDFDSVEEDEFELIKNYSDEIIELNSIKDDTDTLMAVKKAKEKYKNVIILGGINGNRVEHFIANINLFYYFNDLALINKDSMIYAITKDEIFIKDKYKYISFFALEEVNSLSLEGFKYELENYNLKLYDNICISNEINEHALLKMTNGKLLVIKSLK